MTAITIYLIRFHARLIFIPDCKTRGLFIVRPGAPYSSSSFAVFSNKHKFRAVDSCTSLNSSFPNFGVKTTFNPSFQSHIRILNRVVHRAVHTATILDKTLETVTSNVLGTIFIRDKYFITPSPLFQ